MDVKLTFSIVRLPTRGVLSQYVGDASDKRGLAININDTVTAEGRRARVVYMPQFGAYHDEFCYIVTAVDQRSIEIAIQCH